MKQVRLACVWIGATVVALAGAQLMLHQDGDGPISQVADSSSWEGPDSPWTDLLSTVSQEPRLSITEMSSAFGVLRSRAEQAPPNTDAHIAKTLGARPGSFLIKEAHYVKTSVGGVWVVVGSRSIMCLIQAGHGALMCAPASLAARIGLRIGVFEAPRGRNEQPDSYLLLGIVPDRVKRVRLQIDDVSEVATVRDNAYAFRASAPILIGRFCGRAHRSCWVPSMEAGSGQAG